MNQFLDQLLNPAPSVKRRSHTQNNGDMKKKVQEQKRIQEDLFDRKESQLNLQDVHSDQYERQEITEQVVFDQELAQNAISPKKYSLPRINNRSNQQQREDNYVQHTQTRQLSQNSCKIEKYLINQGFVEGSGSYQQPYAELTLQQNAPFIMSIQNEEMGRNINIRMVETLINDINSAKQTQIELVQWFQEQKNCFSQLISQIIFMTQTKIKQTLQKVKAQKRIMIESSIRDQIKKQVSKQIELKQQNSTKGQTSKTSESSLTMQRKWQIQKKLIKQELQQRYQYRIQKLQQQLQEQRKYSEQLMISYQRSEANRQSQSSNFQFTSDKNNDLIQELQFVKIQLEDKEKLIIELEAQNQKLNQHIFDIQQKIQGIQLEVQTRVRDRVKELQNQHSMSVHKQSPQKTQLYPILQNSSHLQQSSRMFGFQSMNMNIQNQLQVQNQQLKRHIQELQQQKVAIENQLKQQQKIIKFREEQIKKNEQDISFEWSQIDRERQAVLNRQQQLITAEQNISRKISQIRAKQTDLQKWQTQIHKRQIGLDFRQQQIKKKLQQLVERQNQFKIDKQTHIRVQRDSLTGLSNNRRSRNNISEMNHQGGGSFGQTGMNIPQLPLGRKYYPEYDSKNQKSFQNQYQFKNRPEVTAKLNVNKSYQDLDKSYGRLNKQRQRMIITSNNFRSNRPGQNVHQYVLPQTSKPTHHSRSKSRSKQKNMIRNNLNPSSIVSGYKNPSYKGKYIQEFYQNKQSSNLDGLGSKLQRLRDEIKRQIDSIK